MQYNYNYSTMYVAPVQQPATSLGGEPFNRLPSPSLLPGAGYHAPLSTDPHFFLVSLYPLPSLLPCTVPAYDPFQSYLFSNPQSQTPPAKVDLPQINTETKAVSPNEDSLVGSPGAQCEEVKETPKCHFPKQKPPKKKTRLQDTPRFRFKQDLIENTLDELHNMFAGLVLSDDKALRGETTIRLHVKTETAIRSIVECMKQIVDIEGVEITQLSTPISMKNRYQKKGFLCYFQISDVNMTETVLDHVKTNFVCFSRCKVALQRHKSLLRTPRRMPNRMAPQVSDGA